MRLLVLGGGSFVGRTVVTEAIGRGWSVTTFSRGRAGFAHREAEALHGDRLVPSDLAVLGGREFDLVVDTWSGAPRAVRDSARALVDSAERYCYVSSRAVYVRPQPEGLDEDSPVVEASPDAESLDYQLDKRGAEVALEQVFGARAVLARAGLILGPHETAGRLAWWLLRLERGGEVLAPGPPALAVQYVDARDLARWVLDSPAWGVSGPVNVVNRPGDVTIEDLLGAAAAVTGSDARLCWVEPEVLEAAGIDRYREMPCWVPPGEQFAGLLSTRPERAFASGLSCRPVAETVADTWSWLLGRGRAQPFEADRGLLGLAPERERALLEAWRSARLDEAS